MTQANRIQAAHRMYSDRVWQSKSAQFYLTDVIDIMDMSGENATSQIINALEAGFMLGYIQGKQDARKEFTSG